MKRLILVFALLFSGCASRHVMPEPAQRVAYKEYIPIACAGRVNGTGFPVRENLVMTAGHVVCYAGEQMTVSLDHGLTWVEPVNWYVHGAYDVAILVVPADFRNVPEFGTPLLGETVTGYGSAYGDTKGVVGFMSRGIVARVTSDYFWFTNEPIGGMSGSAVFGEDGRIVGMVNHGHPDSRVGGSLSGGVTGNRLRLLLDSFVEEVGV